MRADDVILLLEYMGKLPGMEMQAEDEIARLDGFYDPLKGISLSAAPGGAGPGDSTAQTAERAAAKGAAKRISECRLMLAVWRADEAAIRGQFNRLNHRYKILLGGRYVCAKKDEKMTWAQIAQKTAWSERTAKRKGRFALMRLGEMLEEVPMVEEVLARAYNARE